MNNPNRRPLLSRSRFAIGLGLTVGCLCLSGCDPIHDPSAPLAVRESDGQVELALCADMTLSTVLVETRSERTDNEWVSLILLDGDASVNAAQVLSSDSVPEGLAATELNDGELIPGAEVSVLLVRADGARVEADAFMTVPANGIPYGSWLLPNSTVDELPCP
jgi:hypothetical protein